MPPLSHTTQHVAPISTTTNPNTSSTKTTALPPPSNLPTLAVSKLPTPPSSPSEPAFICTLCWLPQTSPVKPKLLGTSSRIVCAPCWRAVLDLSICWVCGECVVRGDDVVSLGWCFWHRGCFGCLVCGNKLSLERLRGWGRTFGERREGVRGGGRMIGVELEEIPLCGTCEIETEGETKGQVLERGLETVSRFDGGLSRDRLEMLYEERESGELFQASRHSIRIPRRLRGATRIETELKRFINVSWDRSGSQQWNSPADMPEDETSLLHNAADMGISEEGAVDEDNCHPDDELTYTGKDAEPSKPDVYVSVFDPISEPAFTPSKTKPLPKWMLLLPSNIQRERERQHKTCSSAGISTSQEMDMLEQYFGSELGNYCKPSGNHLHESPSEETIPRSQRSPIAAPSSPIDIPASIRKSATISIDPKLIRKDTFGSVDYRGYRRSQTIDSIYMTPPEYHSKQLPPRQRTLYPGQTRPPMNRQGTTSYFSHASRKSSLSEPVNDSCCALPAHLKSLPQSPEGSPASNELSSLKRPSPFVANSSEYLERYHPRTSDTKIQTYVPTEPEPILSKIKRQRVGRKNLGEVAEETVEKRKNSERSVKLSRDEEYGLDPRREDLKKELRNLFCEE